MTTVADLITQLSSLPLQAPLHLSTHYRGETLRTHHILCGTPSEGKTTLTWFLVATIANFSAPAPTYARDCSLHGKITVQQLLAVLHEQNLQHHLSITHRGFTLKLTVFNEEDNAHIALWIE